MAENNGGSKIAFFLSGLGIGAILGLLFAPKSGRETRDYIVEKTEEGKHYVTSTSKELRKQAEEMIEKSKELLTKGKELASAAYEATKQGYQEAKSKGRS